MLITTKLRSSTAIPRETNSMSQRQGATADQQLRSEIAQLRQDIVALQCEVVKNLEKQDEMLKVFRALDERMLSLEDAATKPQEAPQEPPTDYCTVKTMCSILGTKYDAGVANMLRYYARAYCQLNKLEIWRRTDKSKGFDWFPDVAANYAIHRVRDETGIQGQAQQAQAPSTPPPPTPSAEHRNGAGPV